MKNYRLYKNYNSVKVKALILSMLFAGSMLIGSTSCAKKKDENGTALEGTNRTETTAPSNTEEILVPVTYYDYDLNSYEFKDNKFSIVNTDFEPSDEAYNKLMSDISSYGYNTSFIAVSLNDGMSFGYNVDKTYWSASTIKCAYALYVCKLIDEGKALFDDILTVTSKFNSVGSGKIRYMPRGTELTLKEVLHYTLDVSDNQGYHMLNDRFKSSDFNLMLESLGCEDMKLPSYSRFCDVNCRSFALVWQEIINYCNKNTEAGKFLYNTLLNAQYNYIKQGITDKASLHKSGWYQGRVCNDTGVVLDEENPYIIIVLTEYNGKNQIIRISQDIDTIMEEYTLYLKENYNKINTNKQLVYKKKTNEYRSF